MNVPKLFGQVSGEIRVEDRKGYVFEFMHAS